MDGETYPGGSDKEACRAPKRADLRLICSELNRLGAKYLVVGGFAIIEAGLSRTTGDIDLLIDPDLQNEAKVYEALRALPDKAVNQLDPGDVAKFTVVRVGDEVLVDIMATACGVDYATAIQDAHHSDVEGVRVPFASPKTLWKMKQTRRDKDIPDLLFLQKVIAGAEELNRNDDARNFWDRFWGKKQS
jgi:hypothetical protein